MNLVFKATYDLEIDTPFSELMRSIEPGFAVVAPIVTQITASNLKDDLSYEEYHTLIDVLKKGLRKFGARNVEITEIKG